MFQVPVDDEYKFYDDENDETDTDYSETYVETRPLTPEEQLLVALEKRGVSLCPPHLRAKVLRDEHRAGHFGRDAMYNAVVKRLKLWWPKIRRDIEDEVGSCDPCLSYMVARAQWHPSQSVSAQFSWGSVRD